MSAITAPQRPVLSPSDVRTCAVSFAGQLDTGELLTGTPTVAEQTTSDLTITGPAVSGTALTINGASVAAGAAVQFKVSGQTVANGPYKIKITVSTDATPAQTFVRYVWFEVRAE